MNSQPSHQVQLVLPEPVYQWFSQVAHQREQAITTVIQTALTDYMQHFDMLKTQTWALCGAFTVAESKADYPEKATTSTNYAEQVDTVLYGTSQ